MQPPRAPSDKRLLEAHAKMSEALDILDDVIDGADIAAHLDLAIARLETCLGIGNARGSDLLRATLEFETMIFEGREQTAKSPWTA